MPTQGWLQSEFDYGYDSGDVLALVPDASRAKEESIIGGSYRRAFCEGCLPYIRSDFKVMELGPGRGSWSRALLHYLTQGELHTVDFQDVRPWLKPEKYQGRLVCHQTNDNLYSFLPENYFDFFWSFGVLCHNNVPHIKEIMTKILPKMKRGALCVHQYSNWDKLDRFGWDRGGVPREFRSLPDDAIWWVRNSEEMMTAAVQDAGWQVLCGDLQLLERDSMILLQRP
jgi:hypothetical protein